jgi:hypothetical protein
MPMGRRPLSNSTIEIGRYTRSSPVRGIVTARSRPCEATWRSGARGATLAHSATGVRLKPSPNSTLRRDRAPQLNSSVTRISSPEISTPIPSFLRPESTFLGACAASAASGTPPLRFGRTRCVSPRSAQGLRMKAAMSAVANEGGNHAGMYFNRTVSPDTRRAVRALLGHRKRSRGNAGQ